MILILNRLKNDFDLKSFWKWWFWFWF